MGCCCGKEKSSKVSPTNGPVKNRSCTDIICLIFFFAVICGYIVVSAFAWLNGNPLSLVYPTDSDGRICGTKYGDIDLTSRPNLFFFDLTKCATASVSLQCQTKQICVSDCPSEAWTYLTDKTAVAGGSTTIDGTKYFCEYNYDAEATFTSGGANVAALDSMIEGGHCAAYYLPSSAILGRCIPLVDAAATSFTSEGETLADADGATITGGNLDLGKKVIQEYLNARDIATKIFGDFASSWYWILVGIFLSAILSFLWIVISRWIVGPMIWITLSLIMALCIFGLYYTYSEWQRLKNVDGSDTTLVSTGFTTELSEYLALQDTWLAFFIILCVVTFILLVVILFLRKRIQIAIQIMKESSKAVSSMTSTLFYPIVTLALIAVVIASLAATELFLATSGKPTYKVIAYGDRASLNGDDCDPDEWAETTHTYYNDKQARCSFIGYGGDSLFQQNKTWLMVAVGFLFLWLLNWVLALGQCTLAGAYASYYWAFDKSKDIPALPLFSAFGRSLRYHTGSLAFGSFIIALIQFIRILLEYLDRKLRGSENKVAKFFMCICKCCCWCLEKILKYVSRNAYIMIAIYGRNFCSSAVRACKLIISNVVRAVVLDNVAGFILFIGKLMIVAAMVALSWAFFGGQISFASSSAPNLNYYWMPIIVIGIGSYVIASGFLNTYGMAIDTVFLCFLEDLDLNDGSEEKPYYMTKGLMEVLGKKNKKDKNKKEE